MTTSAVDATTGGRSGREDEVVLLVRFVQPISVIGSHLRQTGRRRTQRQRYRAAKRRGDEDIHAKPSEWHEVRCAVLQ